MTTSVSRIPQLYVNSHRKSSGQRRHRSASTAHRHTSEVISLDAIDSVDLDQLNRKRRHRSHSRHHQESRPSSERSRGSANVNREFAKLRESSPSVEKLVDCDNGRFRLSRKDVNGNSSSDETVESSERFDLSSVKQSLNSLKQIVKANQPSFGLNTNLLLEGIRSEQIRTPPKYMDVDGENGNGRTRPNHGTININTETNRLFQLKDSHRNRSEKQRVNDNDFKRCNTSVNKDTRLSTTDNEFSRVKNINKGNVQVLKMNVQAGNNVSRIYILSVFFSKNS